MVPVRVSDPRSSVPWWVVALVVLGGLFALIGVAFHLLVRAVRSGFHQMVQETVVNAGSALRGAGVEVHDVAAVPAPADPSTHDLDEDNEQYCEELDGQPWGDDGANYYRLDVTITPAVPDARWDPSGLALIPADYEPRDPLELSEEMCPLHTAEVFESTGFRTAPGRMVRGPRRVRLLFAVHDGLRAVKFANVVTYFGRAELPAPLPKTPRPAGR